MALIAADDHVIGPPRLDRSAPVKHREISPYTERGPDDTEDRGVEGRHYPLALEMSPQTGKFRSDGTGDDLASRSYDDLVLGTHDVTIRTGRTAARPWKCKWPTLRTTRFAR